MRMLPGLTVLLGNLTLHKDITRRENIFLLDFFPLGIVTIGMEKLLTQLFGQLTMEFST